MIIIPAIDLQNGRCVRLEQGQFDRVSIYEKDPMNLAANYTQAGATHLHLVDLDGAKKGSMQQLELIKGLTAEGLSLQVGGGIRDFETALACLDAGIERIVLGSIAISNPKETITIIQEAKPQRVILALDVRIEETLPNIVIHGWQTATKHSLWERVSFYQDWGIDTILCTDVTRDGMLSGPNIALYEEALSRFPTIQWQASAGVRDREDLKKLSRVGVAAAILGRVLYDPHFNLKAAIESEKQSRR
ncbi:MAG: 1-(5-phosphoribosyl)-5-[(5-phosphoribosylamino)methylideneamino]imidazole-4-carboxamide isomerase [Verrucomicrobiae bacterium]|jgi:phosphoribosylformimino-5-aminoimidazole carboxamide ribotide isomerase|nr:1-(5-phosphoribosyl)-5-[(5-phosphoribosylamino)methylideneamino]imidazole-4-carboxamide isomerase [Verrucomicrobiae bacterium]